MNNGMNYINGDWVAVASKRTRKSLFDNSELTIPLSSKNDVDYAVDSAKKVLHNWKRINIDKRVEIVSRIAYFLQNDSEIKDRIIENIIKEIGKPRIEAETEIIEAIDVINYFSFIAIDSLKEEKNSIDAKVWPHILSKTIYEPHGVVGLIKPWNYPFSNPLWGMIPALLSGNTVVFKPSELSSNTSQSMMCLFEKAGFPNGVVNLICGDSETGKYLVEHNDIDMISFTGSVAIGSKIEKCCVDKKIPYSLELGGNDAAIITKNANIELAAKGVVWGAFTNAGQVCTGIKRVILNKIIHDEFIDTLIKIVSKLRFKIDIPPIVTRERALSILDYINDAVKKGGEVLSGGSIENDSYIHPTIINNCNDKMKLYHEEVFGPLMPIFLVSNDDEAIEIANSTKYGLGASVWTDNIQQAHNIANMLNVGMVWINEVNMPFPQAPWCGRKSSGPGIELSIYGLRKFLKIKHICEETSGKSRAWWYPY